MLQSSLVESQVEAAPDPDDAEGLVFGGVRGCAAAISACWVCCTYTPVGAAVGRCAVPLASLRGAT